MIPALDVQAFESMDALSFSIILNEECNGNVYEEGASAQQSNSGSTTKVLNSFSKLLSKKDNVENLFPMSFESEHVPQIINSFGKLQIMAIEKQQDLAHRFQSSQQ